MAKQAKKAADNLKKSKKLEKIVDPPEAEALPAPKRASFGAISLYEERFDQIAYEMACRGLTQTTIAARFGVAGRTLRLWMQQHPSLSKAIDEGLAVAVGGVENAIYRAATGFYYEEQVLNKDGEVVTLRKYEKPNVTAQIFFVCNRSKEDWKNVNRVEHTGDGGGPMVIEVKPPPMPERELSEAKTIDIKPESAENGEDE